MQENEIAAYAATGALGLFTLIKALSHIIRSWTGDRKEDKVDKSAGNQIDLLEKENKDLREENTRLRDDWKKLAKEEAALSAEIQSLKVQVKEQNERISNLSRLIIHIVKIQGKDLPPEVVLSIIAPMQEITKEL